MTLDDRDSTRGRPSPSGPFNLELGTDTLLDDEFASGPAERLSDQHRAALRQRVESSTAAREDLESLRNTVRTLRSTGHPCPDLTPRVTASLAEFLDGPDPFIHPKSRGWVLPTLIAASLTLVTSTLLLVVLPAANPPESRGATDYTHGSGGEYTAEPGPLPRASRGADRPRNEGRPLQLGPTDTHDFARRWETDLPGHVGSAPSIPREVEPVIAGTESAAGRSTGISPLLANGPRENPPIGRLISVRLGPAWSLWWVGEDRASAGSTPADPMGILSTLSEPENSSKKGTGPAPGGASPK
ncbi:MAG: hypothetical protein KF787_01750 [Phycisphaeraceae bacterium]|nr:hypothetical protein [Phycisphaerae bacterium]MBX3391347.1 hypothetical protein [Phycisphaeraceae bacterium]